MYLTATDSTGLSSTSWVDVVPNTVTISLATIPAGLRVTLDGQPVTSPSNVVSVVGVVRSLGVVSPQTAGGLTYHFSRWSDGGAATHTIATPTASVTITATYTTQPTAPTALRVVP